MSTVPDPVAAQRVPPRAGNALFATAVLNTFGMTVLFGSEIGFVAVALDWALAGLLDLGPVLHVPLGIITLGGSAWATYWIARRTWEFERTATD